MKKAGIIVVNEIFIWKKSDQNLYWYNIKKKYNEQIVFFLASQKNCFFADEDQKSIFCNMMCLRTIC